MILYIILALFLLLFAYAGIPLAYSRYKKLALSQKAALSKEIFLTFDDGPGKQLTPVILDMLEQFNIKAAFFLSGHRIAGNEDLVRRIAKQGHIVCSHGMNHPNYMKISPWSAIRDIKLGWQAIDEALGTKQGRYPFRPPYGKLNIICLLYLLVCRVPVIYWTIDVGDTAEKGPVEKELRMMLDKNGGGVVLAHDFDRDDGSIAEFVVNSVKTIMDISKKTSKKIVPLSGLLE